MPKLVSMFIASLTVAGLASACAVDASEEVTGESESALACANQDGTNAMIAAVAVAAAQELGRWKVGTDFKIERRQYNQEHMVLSTATGAGLNRCAARGYPGCPNLTALLSFQNASLPSSQMVRFPGGETLNPWTYASRMATGWRAQKTCEDRPGGNSNPNNCPAEEHLLTVSSIERGGCDTNYTFLAKTPAGGALGSPSLLKNKLLWAGGDANPYLAFQSTASTVTIDPTWDLNAGGSQQGGSCIVTKQKYSVTSLVGQCCKVADTAPETTFIAMSSANMYKCNG